MQVSNVSFGSVTAVSGKPKRVNKVSSKLYPQIMAGDIIMKDVTPIYKNKSSNGMLAKSAQEGNKVLIFITGKDTDKVKNKESDWDSIGGILSNLSSYLNVDNSNVDEVVNNIYSS